MINKQKSNMTHISIIIQRWIQHNQWHIFYYPSPSVIEHRTFEGRISLILAPRLSRNERPESEKNINIFVLWTILSTKNITKPKTQHNKKRTEPRSSFYSHWDLLNVTRHQMPRPSAWCGSTATVSVLGPSSPHHSSTGWVMSIGCKKIVSQKQSSTLSCGKARGMWESRSFDIKTSSKGTWKPQE